MVEWMKRPISMGLADIPSERELTTASSKDQSTASTQEDETLDTVSPSLHDVSGSATVDSGDTHHHLHHHNSLPIPNQHQKPELSLRQKRSKSVDNLSDLLPPPPPPPFPLNFLAVPPAPVKRHFSSSGLSVGSTASAPPSTTSAKLSSTTKARPQLLRIDSYYTSKILSRVSDDAQKRLDEITIDKLQFHKLGVLGRETEIRQIRKWFHRDKTVRNKNNSVNNNKNNQNPFFNNSPSNPTKKTGLMRPSIVSRQRSTATAARNPGGLARPSVVSRERSTVTESASSAAVPSRNPGAGIPRPAVVSRVSSTATPRIPATISRTSSTASGSQPVAPLTYRSLLLIGGRAGTGKSRMARATLAPMVERKKGVLLSGKHDQQQGDSAYVALVSCCEAFCSIVAQRPPDQVEELKETLQTELRSERRILTSIIPSLSDLMGVAAPTHDDNEPDGSVFVNAKLRFTNAFLQLMRIICGLFGPVVLLIDDLQWCDDSSFQLMNSLLHDDENSHLFIVGTYRKEEIAKDVLWERLGIVDERTINEDGLADWQFPPPSQPLQHDVNQLTLEIGNLRLAATVQMLVELLSRTPEDVEPLAQLVHRKTLGNAFFMVQFLTILHQRKLLEFNLGLLEWTWNLTDIDKETLATDNVAGLVQKRMEALPAHLRDVLPVLGSIGSSFSSELFHLVMQHVRRRRRERFRQRQNAEKQEQFDANASTIQGLATSKFITDSDILRQMEEQGLIELQTQQTYRWIHDKVQEAARMMVAKEELEAMQYALAVDFLEHMTKSQQEEHVHVLSHLLRTAQTMFPPGDPERHQIAGVRLRAGRKALRQAAFYQAADELQAGIALLEPNSWETDYELSLDLYSLAAEANVHIGKRDTMQDFARVVLLNTKGGPLLHRRRAYNAQAMGLVAQGNSKDAAKLMVKILSKLRVRFPPTKIGLLTLRVKMLNAQKKAGFFTERIAMHRHVEDEEEKWICFLLSTLTTAWYLEQHPLCALSGLKEMDYALKNGISECTAPCLAVIGLLCIIGLRDPQTGCLYAQESLELLDTEHSKTGEAKTMFICYHLVLHFTNHSHDCKKYLIDGYHSGLAHGDSIHACWCLCGFLDQAFVSGALLDALIQDCRSYVRKVLDLQQILQGFIMSLMWQSAMNLAGRSDNPLILRGEAINEEQWLQSAMSMEQWHIFVSKFRIHVAVIMGAYDKAMEIILTKGCDPKSQERRTPGYYSCYWLYFHCTIAAASMARDAPIRKRYYHQRAQKYGKHVQAWAGRGSPNLKHMAALVTAELADLSGRKAEADKAFQKAIIVAARLGFRQDRAMAHERFGDFNFRSGDTDAAKYQYEQSIIIYREWGAVAKVEQLEEKHRELLGG